MQNFSAILVMLILYAGCTFQRKETVEVQVTPTPEVVVSKPAVATEGSKAFEKESQKILHWFEQMDAIFREGLWVIRQERAPQGKSIFGKMQRALLVDLKQKLSNKSIFGCDVYSMTRNIPGPAVFPQSAEVMHQCNSKEKFVKIGSWNHPTANDLEMNFLGGNLSEVLGMASGVLSPNISCKLKSSENGHIENFNCSGLIMDYEPAKNQILRFNQFSYQKKSKNILSLKAEILENLDPVKKIEVEVPLEGKITVTETVLQEPEFEAKQVPALSPTISPVPKQLDAISAEDKYHDQNGKEIDREEDPQSRGVRQAPASLHQQAPENSEEGVIENVDQESPHRESNTR